MESGARTAVLASLAAVLFLFWMLMVTGTILPWLTLPVHIVTAIISVIIVGATAYILPADDEAQ